MRARILQKDPPLTEGTPPIGPGPTSGQLALNLEQQLLIGQFSLSICVKNIGFINAYIFTCVNETSVSLIHTFFSIFFISLRDSSKVFTKNYIPRVNYNNGTAYKQWLLRKVLLVYLVSLDSQPSLVGKIIHRNNKATFLVTI